MLDQRAQIADGIAVSCRQLAELILRLRHGFDRQIPAGHLAGNLHQIAHGLHDARTQIERHDAGESCDQQDADDERPLRLLILFRCLSALLMDEILVAVDDAVQLVRHRGVLTAGAIEQRCRFRLVPILGETNDPLRGILVRAPSAAQRIEIIAHLRRDGGIHRIESDIELIGLLLRLLCSMDAVRQRRRRQHRVLALTIVRKRTAAFRADHHARQVLRRDPQRAAVDLVQAVPRIEPVRYKNSDEHPKDEK